MDLQPIINGQEVIAFMNGVPSSKTAIRYRDNEGRVRVKNCGNAKGVRDCLAWLRKKNFQLIDKTRIIAVDGVAENTTRQRIHR